MKEVKTVSGSPEAREVVGEMMVAFEAFKDANDERVAQIEKKAAADTLLEEKVARIDQAVAAAQARLDRLAGEARRPVLGEGGEMVSSAPEAKAAFDGYLKTGSVAGLEVKAGLSSGASSGGYVVPPETERAIERRLMAVGGVFAGARADGGPVAAGGAYPVGERGPEVFRPGVGGSVQPLGGAGPVVVNVTVDGGVQALLRSQAQVARRFAGEE